MKIIADNTIPYLKGVIDRYAEVEYLPSGGFTAAAVKEADALIVRSVDKCTREVLEGSRVKLITTATIGYDHIDTAFCASAGIAWMNAPGSNAMSVAQYVLACLVNLSLRTGEPLQGKTIGIVGVGHVGRHVERLCRIWGLTVLLNDPPRAEIEGAADFVSLQTIAEEADIITFHTPLLKEGRYPTYHLADLSFIHTLKKKPWLLNSARGAVHDTGALLMGIQSGKVGSLVIDCWENEPDINRELLLNTTIATPHIAGFSADGKANATRMCLENLNAFFHLGMEQMIREITPPPPLSPFIDLDAFPANRMENAILSCFDPTPVDKSLRERPERFEWFRANYHYPREFNAYSIKNATAKEIALLNNCIFASGS